MLNNSKERLQQLFAASRARQAKKKLLQQQRYKKAQEAVKKALAERQSKEQEKCAQNDWKEPQIEFSRNFTIYNNKFIERFMDDEDVYKTREELEEAMPSNINWKLWNELVEQTRKELQE